MKIINPRTGEADYEIAPLDAAELAALTHRMRAAQPRWAARSPEERGIALRKLGTAITRHREAIIAALANDTGRFMISTIEVDGTPRLIDRWASSAPALIADASITDRPTVIPGISTSTRLIPFALVGAISPWNFPLTLALIDAIPALMAGCAVIIKPSEVTPRFIAPLMAAIAEVPELADVLVLIEGDGATGAALVEAVDILLSPARSPRAAKLARRQLGPSSLQAWNLAAKTR